MNEDKKQKERKLLDQLQIAFPKDFKKEWRDIQQDQEPPDFSSESTGEKIGLEITRYHSKGSGVRCENLIAKLRDLCAAKSADWPDSPSHVTIWSNYAKWPIKQNKDEVSNQIVELIKSNIPSTGSSCIIVEDDFPPELQDCGIIKISVSPPSEFRSQIHWQFPQADSFQTLDDAQLQLIIDKKNTSRKIYSEKFDQTWLVIVAEAFGASSFLDPRTPLEIEADSHFDMTFIFTLSTHKLIRIIRGSN